MYQTNACGVHGQQGFYGFPGATHRGICLLRLGLMAQSTHATRANRREKRGRQTVEISLQYDALAAADCGGRNGARRSRTVGQLFTERARALRFRGGGRGGGGGAAASFAGSVRCVGKTGARARVWALIYRGRLGSVTTSRRHRGCTEVSAR